MFSRKPWRVILLLLFSFTGAYADGEYEYFRLTAEPLIRIGLSTNSSSVSITTGDSSLVAVSPDEPSKLLATTKVTVSARAYRPPEVENYRIEFQNLASQTDANELAKDIRDRIGTRGDGLRLFRLELRQTQFAWYNTEQIILKRYNIYDSERTSSVYKNLKLASICLAV